jgi:hypothetical protein
MAGAFSATGGCERSPSRTDAFRAASAAAAAEGRMLVVYATAGDSDAEDDGAPPPFSEQPGVEHWLDEHAFVFTLNVDAAPELAAQLKIGKTPVLIAWRTDAEQEYDRLEGALPPPGALMTWLHSCSYGSVEAEEAHPFARMDALRRLKEQGHFEQAIEAYVYLVEEIVENKSDFSRSDLLVLSMLMVGTEELIQDSEVARRRIGELRDWLVAGAQSGDLEGWIVTFTLGIDMALEARQEPSPWLAAIEDGPGWQGWSKAAAPMMTYRSLISEGQWALAGLRLRQPIAWLEWAHHESLVGAAIYLDRGPLGRDHAEYRRTHQETFRDDASECYVALLAAGREEDAHQVAARAQELDSEPGLVIALVEKALKIGQPRRDHLDWLDAIERPDAVIRELRLKVVRALSDAPAQGRS